MINTSVADGILRIELNELSGQEDLFKYLMQNKSWVSEEITGVFLDVSTSETGPDPKKYVAKFSKFPDIIGHNVKIAVFVGSAFRFARARQIEALMVDLIRIKPFFNEEKALLWLQESP
jgi:hypothetical protein